MKYQLKINYLCPHCRAYLRVWNNIIFVVRSESQNQQAILLLNPKLGNYEVIHHTAVNVCDGNKLIFLCPVCHAELTATGINENLNRIIMIDEKKIEFDVYFSRICGEHTTFLIHKDDIIERYGEDSSSYVNYFMSRLKKGKKDKSD